MFGKIFKTTFFRHASILQVGNFAQFGISFAGSILIARVLGPEQYGIYALAIALAGIFGLLLDIGQGYGSLVLFSRAFATQDALELRRIGGFYIRATALLYAFIGIPLFIGAGYIGELIYHRADLGLYVRLLLAVGVFTAGVNLFTLILQVIRRVWLLVAVETLNQALTTACMIVAILFGLGVAGVFSGLLAASIASATLTFYFYRRYARTGSIIPRIRSMAIQARTLAIGTYIKFSFPVALDRNMTELYTFGIMLLLGRLAAPSEVGFFRIALSYISLSLFILGPVSRLLQDQFPKDQASSLSLLRSHFLKVSLLSGFTSMGIGTVLVLIGPFLLQLVYGTKYLGAAPLIWAFWWYAALIGFGVGLGSLYRTLGRVSFNIKLNAVIIILGMPTCYFLIRHWGAPGAVYGFTAMKALATAISFAQALRILSEGHQSVT